MANSLIMPAPASSSSTRRKRRSPWLRSPKNNDSNNNENRRLWTGDSQKGYTNDSRDGGRRGVDITFRDGYPIEYNCEREMTDSSIRTYQKEIMFDYELTFSGSSFRNNLKALEWSVLWQVAKSTRLHKCDFGYQESEYFAGESGGLRGETVTASAAVTTKRNLPPHDEPKYIVGLGSDLVDVINVEQATCAPRADRKEDTLCVPMKGSMNVMYTEFLSEYQVQDVVEQQIQRSFKSQEILVESVVDLTWVGGYQNIPRDVTLTSISAPESPSRRISLSGVSIGLVVAIGFLIISFIAMLVGWHYSGRRKEHQQIPLQASPSDLTDQAIAEPSEIGRMKDNTSPTSVYLASRRQPRRKLSKRKSDQQTMYVAPLGSIPECDDESSGATSFEAPPSPPVSPPATLLSSPSSSYSEEDESVFFMTPPTSPPSVFSSPPSEYYTPPMSPSSSQEWT